MRHTSYLKAVSTSAEEFPESTPCLTYGLVRGQPTYFTQQEDLFILRHKVWDIVRVLRPRYTMLGKPHWHLGPRIAVASTGQSLDWLATKLAATLLAADRRGHVQLI
jgi:hypothetical protein